MLVSLALIFLCGMLLGGTFKRIRLPGLLGMLGSGMILGPHMLDVLDANILSISADLRQLAFIIILMRTGLLLDMDDLKKVGRPAILMCFLPACFEIAGVMLLAPKLLSISIMEAAITGIVVAAVSPAVIVPKMLHFMENRYGTDKCIPQMIMAGASVDGIFIIVIFAAVVGLAQGQELSAAGVLQVPFSLIAGILIGIVSGVLLGVFFKKVHIRDSSKVILLLSVSILLVAAGNLAIVPFSGLLAAMSMGGAIKKRDAVVADRLSNKYSKLWVAAEVVLFALVGATVDLKYAAGAGLPVAAIILGALVFRMAGVFLCMIGTNFSFKEKLFCMIAYVPKATVQAAIGSLPLAMGLACGNIVLTAAVLAILITAPLGALGVDLTYKKLLRYQK